MKICATCKKEKSLKEFGSNIRKPDGLHYMCKECANKGNKEAKYRHRYGITLAEKAQMIADQDAKCAICNNPLEDFSNACVDHNHITKQVRSILCQECNKGLGSFKDNPSFLRQAASYLDSWNND